jgi:hypothetical protein
MLWGASSPISSYMPLEWVLGACDVGSNDKRSGMGKARTLCRRAHVRRPACRALPILDEHDVDPIHAYLISEQRRAYEVQQDGK